METGHGVHLYWILKPESTTKLKLALDEANNQICPAWRELQKALIEFCKSDKSIKDLPRIMRLPGSNNVKDPKNPILCKVVESTDKKYSLADFQSILNPYKQKQKQREKRSLKEQAEVFYLII